MTPAALNREQAATKIYFVGMDKAPYVKVGIASCVSARVANLQSANPERLHLYGAVDGNLETEAKFHEVLARVRCQGEWFRKGPWLETVRLGILAGYDAETLLKKLWQIKEANAAKLKAPVE